MAAPNPDLAWLPSCRSVFGPSEIGAVPGGELTQPATKPGQLAESGGAAPSAQRRKSSVEHPLPLLRHSKIAFPRCKVQPAPPTMVLLRQIGASESQRCHRPKSFCHGSCNRTRFFGGHSSGINPTPKWLSPDRQSGWRKDSVEGQNRGAGPLARGSNAAGTRNQDSERLRRAQNKRPKPRKTVDPGPGSMVSVGWYRSEAFPVAAKGSDLLIFRPRVLARVTELANLCKVCHSERLFRDGLLSQSLPAS